MKTTKVKKEIHRTYSFANASDHWSRDDRAEIEQVRKAVIEEGVEAGPFSDIVETIFYAEVEEKAPDVWEKYVCFAVSEDDKSDILVFTKKEDIEETRERLIAQGYRCSEIEHIRREF